jgi:hypothetical protein
VARRRNPIPDAQPDPRFERRYDITRRTPLGRYPIPSDSKLRAVPCVHCRGTIGLSRWDHWNGFLVVCPHCGGYHGKPWTIERTLLAGFFFNAFSFLLVFRPRNAVIAFLGFLLAGWILVTLAVENEGNDAIMIASLLAIMLGPMLITAAALIRHQSRLDRAPPSDPTSNDS